MCQVKQLRQHQENRGSGGKPTPHEKKGSGGKFRKGTLIRYKYVNGKKVGAVKSRKR